MTMILLSLLQAAQAQPDLSRRAGDVLQVLTAAGVSACVTMLWKFGGRLTTIETVLNDPELGIKPAIVSLRKSRHHDANALQVHETRLDGHDRDLERIDTQLTERRRPEQPAQPFDGRRATT